MPKLKDLADIRTGIAPPQGAQELAGALYVQIKDLDLAKRSLTRAGRPTAGRATPIESGDVLLAARGERNVVLRPDPELVGAYPTLDLYLLRPDPNRVDPDYLAAFLETEDSGRRLRASQAGASLPRIPKDALAELEVPLPTLVRQQALGRFAERAKERLNLIRRLQIAERRLVEAQLSLAFQTLED